MTRCGAACLYRICEGFPAATTSRPLHRRHVDPLVLAASLLQCSAHCTHVTCHAVQGSKAQKDLMKKKKAEEEAMKAKLGKKK